MKYLKRFLEHFSIEGDDNTVKNIADDVFNKIQDEFSDIPFRIIIKKKRAFYPAPGKSMAAEGWFYNMFVLFKVERSRMGNFTSKTNKFITDSRRRFKIPLEFKIVRGTDMIDTYIYSRSYTNNVFQGQTYDSNIIYDEKSDSYIEDVINESHIEDEILKFVYDLDKIKVQLDEMSYEGGGYDLSYDWDESKNRIVIYFGFCGYSDGFSQTMTIEKLRSLGQIKVHISESSSSPYGSNEGDEIKEFDSFDDIIKDIKDNFGL
jgi:hypothetical protein